MRHIRIVAVGKIKQSAKYLETGIQLYQKRIERYAHLDWVELPEESPTPTRPVEHILEREAEQILKQCRWAETSILLSERGKQFTSEGFADFLQNGNPLNGGRESQGSNRIIFIIGGAYGTSTQLNPQVTQVISLSSMTFPHQMVRLLLVEQLYRAFTIANNEPYHK